jgi:hypothetical protein
MAQSGSLHHRIRFPRLASAEAGHWNQASVEANLDRLLNQQKEPRCQHESPSCALDADQGQDLVDASYCTVPIC